MDIVKEKISPRDVSFLSNGKTLYTSDFRAIGESADYKIPIMWKYENLMPWILEGEKVFINNDCDINYFNENDLIVVPKETNPQISIYKRGEKVVLPEDVENLWVAVPHSDADCFAKKNNLKINYSYEDFLRRNNKIKQKELLGDITPPWKPFFKKKETKEFTATVSEGFLKKEYGSGGFTIFNIGTENEKEQLMKMVDESDANWYFEKRIGGTPYSVQCLKERKTERVVIFGFAEQMIEGGKYFKGLDVKPLEILKGDVFSSLCTAIQRMSILLENYEGFFGVDFFIDKHGKALVLEFNIRLTSATIPTLLLNEKDANKGRYIEEEEKIKTERGIVRLNHDSNGKGSDYLNFYKK